MFNINNSGSISYTDNSWVSEDVRITGSISSSKPIMMLGRLDGNVEAKSIHVTATGVVNGDIKADDLKIDGTVIGTIIAAQVHVTASAEIKGKIRCNGITIDKGANIEAQFTRGKKVNG